MPDPSFILSLLIVHWLVTMSPGPNMILVTQTAVARGRPAGFAVIAGICASGAIWVTSAALGLKAVFLASPWLYEVVAWVGAAYLIWLGVGLLRSRSSRPPAPQSLPRSMAASFTRGFLSNITNPKTLVYFSSVFGTVMPEDPDAATVIAAVLVTWTCNFGWYGGLTFMLSGSRARRVFTSWSTHLNRIAGVAMILFGLRVVHSRLR